MRFNSSLAAFVLLVSGCATFEIKPGIESRTFLSPVCPIAGDPPQPESAALVALGVSVFGKIAGNLVGAGIDAIVRNLGEDQAVTVSSSQRQADLVEVGSADNANEPKIATNNKCLVTIVGSFEHGETPATPNRNVLERISGSTQGAQLRLVEQRLKQSPRLANQFARLSDVIYYSEHRLDATKGVTLMAADPLHVFVGAFLGRDAGGVSGRRDILQRTEFAKPGGPVFFSVEVRRDSIGEGAGAGYLIRQNHTHFADTRGIWYAVPAIGKDLKPDASILPFNVTTMYTETRKPGVVAKAIAASLKDAKGDITKTVESETRQMISSTEQQKAEIASLENAAKAFGSYQDAHAAAMKLRQDFSATQDPAVQARIRNEFTVKQKTALALRELARTAFESAGIEFTSLGDIEPLGI